MARHQLPLQLRRLPKQPRTLLVWVQAPQTLCRWWLGRGALTMQHQRVQVSKGRAGSAQCLQCPCLSVLQCPRATVPAAAAPAAAAVPAALGATPRCLCLRLCASSWSSLQRCCATASRPPWGTIWVPTACSPLRLPVEVLALRPLSHLLRCRLCKASLRLWRLPCMLHRPHPPAVALGLPQPQALLLVEEEEGTRSCNRCRSRSIPTSSCWLRCGGLQCAACTRLRLPSPLC